MKTDDELFDMSDEELEAAYKEAIAEQSSETNNELDTDTEEETDIEDSSVDEDSNEDDLEESDSDDSSTDEEKENSDDKSEEESATLDENQEQEDKSDDTNPDENFKDDEQKKTVQSYKFRADGKDYEFTSEEIVEQFPKIFGQSMNYTKKMQAIKPWRKTIDAIETAGLKHDDVNLMIDVLKGDKTAITEVLKRTGIDSVDLDTDEDSNYVTKEYGRDDNALEIKEVIQSISNDAEFKTTRNILDKEWDDKSFKTLSDNPHMIKLLHDDVKSGMYEKLQPLTEKLKVFDNYSKPDIEYYKQAAEQYFNQLAEAENQERLKAEKAENERKQKRLNEVRANQQKRDSNKEASAKRKAAVPSKSAATKKGVIDYLSASDEDFEEWYKKLQF